MESTTYYMWKNALILLLAVFMAQLAVDGAKIKCLQCKKGDGTAADDCSKESPPTTLYKECLTDQVVACFVNAEERGCGGDGVTAGVDGACSDTAKPKDTCCAPQVADAPCNVGVMADRAGGKAEGFQCYACNIEEAGNVKKKRADDAVQPCPVGAELKPCPADVKDCRFTKPTWGCGVASNACKTGDKDCCVADKCNGPAGGGAKGELETYDDRPGPPPKGQAASATVGHISVMVATLVCVINA